MALTLNAALGNGVEYIAGTLPLSAYPFTLSCWIKVASLPGGLQVLVGYSAIPSNNYIILYIQPTGAVGININNVASNQSAQTTATVTTNTWFHVCGTATSGSMSIFLNGANKVSNATVPTFPGTMTILDAGLIHSPAGPAYFNGTIAEMCSWTGVLSDTQIAALAKGAPPNSVVPPGAGSVKLVHYWPMYNGSSPSADLSGGGRNGTVAATAANHAPVGSYARWPNVSAEAAAHHPTITGQRHHRQARSWFN